MIAKQGRIFPIPDEPTTGLKRRVWVHGLNYSEKREDVRIECDVFFFERAGADGTEYGPEVRNRFVQPLSRPMVADRSRLVNPTNGMLCMLDESGEAPVWRDLNGQIVENPVPQYDFFIPALIIHPIQIAGQAAAIAQLYANVVAMGVAEKAFD